jgi:hypothetical protein
MIPISKNLQIGVTVMPSAQCESLSKADLWEEYRFAFQEFAQELRRVQVLRSMFGQDQFEQDQLEQGRAEQDLAALAAACLDLDRARLTYNRQRDALVRELLAR